MAPIIEASVVPAETVNGQVVQTTMAGQPEVVVQYQPGAASFMGEVPPQQQHFQQQQYTVGSYGQAMMVPQGQQQQFQQQQFQQQGIVQAEVVQAVPGVRVVSAQQPYIGSHIVHMPDMAHMGGGGSEHPLVPPGAPMRGNSRSWRFSLDPRCCQVECWCAWCCMCCPLGQIASKINKISETKGQQYRSCWSYQTVVGITILINILLMVTDLRFIDFFFNVIVAMQLRGLVRRFRKIRGSIFEDFCVAFFCTPCSVTQMVMEMWNNPSVTPGCDMSQAPAFRV